MGVRYPDRRAGSHPGWGPAEGRLNDGRVTRGILDGVVLAAAAFLLIGVFQAFAARLTYPYDLEWMEGGMLVHAWRLMEGKPVYTDPDAGWIPFIYPPGYTAVVAAFGKVFGLSTTLGRSISLAGTFAAAAALVFGGWKHGRSWTGGLLAGAVFLLLFPSTGAFYDLIRPDGLSIGLAGWALVVGWLPGRRAAVVSGLLLAAAFTVKHNFALFGLPLVAGIFFRSGWREALAFVAASAGPALLFTLGVEWASGGHFLNWLLRVPGAHPMVGERWLPGALQELASHLGPLLVGTTAAALVLLLPGRPNARKAVLLAGAGVGGLGAVLVGWELEAVYALFGATFEMPRLPALMPWSLEIAFATLGVTLGALGVGAGFGLVEREVSPRWVHAVGLAGIGFLLAGLMRAHHGGFVNIFIPAHFVVLLLAAVAFGRVRHLRPTGTVHALTLVPFALQLLVMAGFEPERFSPSASDVEAGDAFVEALRDCDGPVLSPISPWLPVYAGHEPSWHLMALWDIQHPASPYFGRVPLIGEAAERHHWACVVMGSGRPMRHGMTQNYTQFARPRIDVVPRRKGPPTFMPRTGWRTRPMAVWKPREPVDKR